jgi:putative phage-type endonuclease
MQLEQRTDDWRKIRCGKVTASRVSDVVAKTKTGWGASRNNYMAQLVAERLTGNPQEKQLSNAAIQWGIDTEPKARAAYEFYSGLTVTEIGFIKHPVIELAGCSPDGLVGEDGMVEIKCPNTATHIETLLGSAIDKEYLLQMQFQMACAGRAWCDFCSYDPRLPADLELRVIRIHRDDQLIASLETEITAFLEEVTKKVALLQSLRLAA